MAVVYLGLGSNIGDRTQHLVDACATLHRHPAITAGGLFPLPHGACGCDSPRLVLECGGMPAHDAAPPALLCVTQATERRLGRVTTLRWGPRVIDLDILLYDALQVRTPYLTIPHAALHERRFVLVPLAELAPEYQLPLALGCVICSRPCPMLTTQWVGLFPLTRMDGHHESPTTQTAGSR